MNILDRAIAGEKVDTSKMKTETWQQRDMLALAAVAPFGYRSKLDIDGGAHGVLIYDPKEGEPLEVARNRAFIWRDKNGYQISVVDGPARFWVRTDRPDFDQAVRLALARILFLDNQVLEIAKTMAALSDGIDTDADHLGREVDACWERTAAPWRRDFIDKARMLAHQVRRVEGHWNSCLDRAGYRTGGGPKDPGPGVLH